MTVPPAEVLAARADRPIGIRASTLWLAAGVALSLALLWMVVANATSVVLLVFVAITFAEGIRPVVRWLEAHHVRRELGVLLVYAAIVLVLGGIAFILIAPLLQQLVQLGRDLPSLVQRVQGLESRIQQQIGQVPGGQSALRQLPSNLAGVGQGFLLQAITTPLTLADMFFRLVELYLLAFFWLTATAGADAFLVGLFPPRKQAQVASVLEELSRRLGGYLRGVAINVAAIAVLSGGGLFVLGAPYPILLGFVAGMAETLPLIGPWLAGAVAVLLTLSLAGFTKALEVVVLYLIIHLIEGNTLVPYVMFRVTRTSPFVTILAIALGGALLGIVGAVLSVPIAIVVQVLIERVAAPAIRGVTGAAETR